METLWHSIIGLHSRSQLLKSHLPTAIFLAVLSALYIDTQIGWQNVFQFWQTLTGQNQLALVTGGLIFVIIVSAPFDVFMPTFLRWTEGYWDNAWLFGRLRRWRCNHHRQIIENSQLRFGEMFGKQDEEPLSIDGERQIQNLDELLHYYPSDPERTMPTFLGNIIRASEDYVRVRYGLDPIVTWVRLYPSIDSTIQDMLEKSLVNLHFAVRLTVQTIFFTVSGVLLELILGRWLMSILLLFGGWIIAYLAYQVAVRSAKNYGEFVRCSFDLHRFDLYQSLGLSPPDQSGEDERVKGEVLTQFLWRGDVHLQYTPK